MVTSKVVAFVGIASLLFVSSGCGVIEVAPPRAPDPILPTGIDMPSKAPEAGKTRLVVDANGERASVNEVTGWSSNHGVAWVGGESAWVSGRSEIVKPLCVAPCVVDLEPGVHVLRFSDERDRSRSGEARIQIGERPKLIRHAMGRRTEKAGGEVVSFVLITLGASAAATGGALLPAGAVGEKDDLVLASGITLGIGVTMLLMGIPMAVASRPRVQEGATTEKTLDR